MNRKIGLYFLCMLLFLTSSIVGAVNIRLDNIDTHPDLNFKLEVEKKFYSESKRYDVIINVYIENIGDEAAYFREGDHMYDDQWGVVKDSHYASRDIEIMPGEAYDTRMGPRLILFFTKPPKYSAVLDPVNLIDEGVKGEENNYGEILEFGKPRANKKIDSVPLKSSLFRFFKSLLDLKW